MLSPPRPINKFKYFCGRKFILDDVEELYKEPQTLYGIMQVFGEECTIQLSNEFGEVHTVDVKTTKIQKRQDRGGQSQNRIARLRLETIHNYLKSAAEKAEKAFLQDGRPIISALLVVGSGMKKEQILDYINIPVEYYVHSVDAQSPIAPLILDMIRCEDIKAGRNHFNDIVDMITLTPDVLTFGYDETLEAFKGDKIKTVYCSHEHAPEFSHKKTHIIIMDVEQLKQYGNVVGVKYYA